jgi:hypothetical protein
MTDPIRSQYQAHPWEPVIDGDSSDDERKAAAAYTAVYGGTPRTVEDSGDDPDTTVTEAPYSVYTAYRTAPDLVPTANGTGGASGSAPPIREGAIAVDLAALRAAEQTCLDATSAVVDGYNVLHEKAEIAINSLSFFGQTVTTTENGFATNAMAYSQPIQDNVVDDDFDQEGVQFAASVNPQMSALLRQVGDLLTAMGAFNAALNNAGQMYAYCDHSSAYPS